MTEASELLAHLRHVEVIDEDNEALARGRAVNVLGPLLHVRFETPLHVERSRPT